MKRFFWGFLLIPLGLATFFHLPGLLFSLRSQITAALWLALGATAYCVLEVLFNRPMRTYVFGHELTHALAGLAAGSKIHSFKVSKKGGSVTLSKSNFFIALAPYCIPIYTFMAIAVHSGLKYFHPFAYLDETAQCLVGFSLAFHVSLTLYAVQQRQPDIRKTGLFFSAVFILLINGWVLVFLSKVLFWNAVSVKTFASQTLQTQNDIWRWLAQNSSQAILWVYEQSKSRGIASAGQGLMSRSWF